jgi:N-acetylglucosamine-6-phosphate deacetylase
MKKFLLWSFERGSRPYDVMCIVILAFIFLTPTAVFNDRPDFMRVPSDAAIRETTDDDGHTVFFVQVKTEQAAVDRLKALKASLGEVVTISHTEPVYDTTGALVAYSIWVER